MKLSFCSTDERVLFRPFAMSPHFKSKSVPEYYMNLYIGLLWYWRGDINFAIIWKCGAEKCWKPLVWPKTSGVYYATSCVIFYYDFWGHSYPSGFSWISNLFGYFATMERHCTPNAYGRVDEAMKSRESRQVT